MICDELCSFFSKKKNLILNSFILPPFTGVLTNLINALKHKINPPVTQKNFTINSSFELSWLVSLWDVPVRTPISPVNAIPNATCTRCKGK